MGRFQPILLGLFGFALAVAYVPWINGAGSSPRWGVLALAAMAVMCIHPERNRVTRAHIIGGLFVLWALATLLWSSAPEGPDAAWKLILMALLFVVGASLRDLRPLLVGAAIGVGVSSALVIADVAGLISYPQVSRPSGLFVNGLYLAEFAAMALAGLLGAGLWRWMVLCLPALLMVSLARGPLLACAVVGLAWLGARSFKIAWPLALGLVIILPGIAALRPQTVAERFQTWGDLLGQLSVFGAGLGSYFGNAPLFSSRTDAIVRNLHANNDLLEIAYELGLPGAILALAFVGTLIFAPSKEGLSPAKLIMIVFTVESCFGFPFFLPASAGLFALAAGHLSRDSVVWVLPPWPWRVPLRPRDGDKRHAVEH